MDGHEIDSDGMKASPLLDVRQVAVVLGVNVRTVWRRIASGELAVVRFGHCTRFREADLIGFIERARSGGRS